MHDENNAGKDGRGRQQKGPMNESMKSTENVMIEMAKQFRSKNEDIFAEISQIRKKIKENNHKLHFFLG